MRHESLPAEFEVLEPFLHWAEPETEDERSRMRHAGDVEEMKRFYEVMAPMMGEVYDHLRELPVGELDAESDALFHLALALAEASIVVENFGQANSPIGYDHTQLTIHQ